MNKQPLVSIIMNCYNGQKYLREALNSVLEQTYQNWELIFWDNCSNDSSSSIFEKFNDKRFKYFLANKHTTLYEARNLAIQKSNGSFIAFLDTDDMWLPNKLEKQIPLFDDDSVGLVYGNIWLLNKKNIIKKKKILTKKKLSKGNITKSLLNDYKMPVISIVIRKDFLPDITNVFNAKYDLLADFDFSINFSLKHKFDCIQDPVAIYRRHEFQLSRKLFGKQVKQLEAWALKIKLNSKNNSFDLSSIENKIKYMKIINLIYEKRWLRSLSEIYKHPLNLNKIKLITILVLPNYILRFFRDFT